MEYFHDLPTHVKEQLGFSCLLSSELSSSLVPSIQRELGEDVINVLNRLPTKEWMIAGGFMAFIAGHTSCYGDIDIFLHSYVTSKELGPEWKIQFTIGDSWNYNNFHDDRSWSLIDEIGGGRMDKYVIYNHKNTKAQLIIPCKEDSSFEESESSFLQYCAKKLSDFDIEYCKLGWIGTTKMVIDLRGIKSQNEKISYYCGSYKYQNRVKARRKKYEDRLVNKQLPVPRLGVLAYLKSRRFFAVYGLGPTGFVRKGVAWGGDY